MRRAFSAIVVAVAITALMVNAYAQTVPMPGSGVGGGGSSAFSALTTSTNTTAIMTVGTGGSMLVSGTGTIAATTSTALAANPANCAAGNYPLGIDATGAVEGCTAAGGTTLPVVDTTGISKGSVDATKILRFEVDGLTTGTTRVATMPNVDGTMAMESGQPLGTGTMVGDVWRNISSCTYANMTGIYPATTAEEVLYTCTLAANTLTRDLKSKLRVRATGLHATNTNNSIMRIRLGGLTGAQIGPAQSAISNAEWVFDTELTRITNTSQLSHALAMTGVNAVYAPSINTSTVTLSVDNALVFTMQNSTVSTDNRLIEFSVDVLQ